MIGRDREAEEMPAARLRSFRHVRPPDLLLGGSAGGRLVRPARGMLELSPVAPRGCFGLRLLGLGVSGFWDQGQGRRLGGLSVSESFPCE